MGCKTTSVNGTAINSAAVKPVDHLLSPIRYDMIFSPLLLQLFLLSLVNLRQPEDCCRLVILRSSSTSRYNPPFPPPSDLPSPSPPQPLSPPSPEASRRTYWASTGGRGGSTSGRCTGAVHTWPVTLARHVLEESYLYYWDYHSQGRPPRSASCTSGTSGTSDTSGTSVGVIQVPPWWSLNALSNSWKCFSRKCP